MDKYTVDLDQVLNDFEYSELTDQHSRNVSELPQSTAAFQPPLVTKHSMNNVFHSLNEYLNSNINTIEKDATARATLSIGQQTTKTEYKNLGKFDNKFVDKRYHVNNNNEGSRNFEKIMDEQTLADKKQYDKFENVLEQQLGIKIVESVEHKSFCFKIGAETANNIEHGLNKGNEEQGIEREETIGNTHGTLEGFGIKQEDKMEKNIKCKDSKPETENPCIEISKTENVDCPLLVMENFESNLRPELNCTDNILTEDTVLDNKDNICDNGFVDKDDNVLEGSGGSFRDSGNFEGIPNIQNKNNILVQQKIKDVTDMNNTILPNICDKINDDFTLESANTVENFIIEPSESFKYAEDSSHCNEGEIAENIAEKKWANSNSDKCITGERNDGISVELDDKVEIKDDDNVSNKGNFNQDIELPLEVKNQKDSDKSDVHQDLLELKEDRVPSNHEEININNENTELSSNYMDTPASTESGINKYEYSINTINEKSSAPVVRFTENLDIEESELNKMLNELEEDDCIGQTVENSFCKESKDADKYGNFVKDENIIKESEGMVVGIEEEDVSVKPSETETQDPEFFDCDQKLESNNTKTLTENAQHKEKFTENECVEIKSSRDGDNVVECLEEPKPSNNEGNSVHQSQKTGEINEKKIISDVQCDLNDIQDENKNSDTETIGFSGKEQSHELSARPQNLPLNNGKIGENVARKIDLIGSPGSTPYNNVYINKTIPPKLGNDIESDCSTSASPTFSDCSTDSTSTASTVSAEDTPKDKETKRKTGKKSDGAKSRENIDRQGGTFSDGAQTKGVQSDASVKDDVSVEQDHTNFESINAENTIGNENPVENVASEQTISDTRQGETQGRRRHEAGGEMSSDKSWLGKEAPLWIPDSNANACLHCDIKFTVLRRRHHCRACGLVLCSKCCGLKYRLDYLNAEARVCTACYGVLNRDANSSGSEVTPESGNSPSSFRPNPNNPLEYCSTVSPLQQVGQGEGGCPPTVMVPVGVLKRKGSNKKSNKSVMFCDGIAPGSDLTRLDQDFNYSPELKVQHATAKVADEAKEKAKAPRTAAPVKVDRNLPKVDPETKCFIPSCETSLPPTICVNKTDISYSDCSNSPSVVEMLKNEALIFAINSNLFVHVKLTNKSCCINKQAWCFSTEGLINVGSEEIVILLEYIEEESFVPKDIFFHIHNVYVDAVKGTSIKELGLSLHNSSTFLDSKNHAGFVYIRPSFQCLENVLKPKEPFLIGILIHRWETPWAKLFPLRLILRLGAEYRYYPSPVISTRHRESVFVEIGHTIINLLADFRNFTYTLPQIRGLIIHMEDKNTTITIPRNRYDQVMKSINNSSEHILAFAGNFSPQADSHLVCIQDTQGHENSYTTHAINIHNKPRKVTGASFIVFNGSLKSTSGLTAKSNIVEDGLMIQVPPDHMEKIRDHLRNMKNHVIACGCVNATSDETVNIVWGENDADFNVGILSPVDLTEMKGIPSIRVHNGKDYFCNSGNRLIRWTEVFILQNGEENPKNQDPIDISKVSESIAKACCNALVKYLDLLVSNSFQKIGIRTTLHVEKVSYSAGSNGLKLPPIYMRSLDNELVPVLHRITSNNLGDNAVVLELIFRILNA